MSLKPDKIIKEEFKALASKNPHKYYATTVLEEMGFVRKQCKASGTFFWTTDSSREYCGDAEYNEGFQFFKNNPSKESLSYVDVWKRFSQMMKERGYTVVNRYPVVARWNPTMEYTIASIAAFQPYVVSGEVQAPAKKLVIPQFCLRFGDVDNVGITMSHMTGFVMIGQHQFVPPDEWSQEQAFRDIVDWLLYGLGLPKEEIVFHEDAWAGGGNYGPCMEFFCRGVELGNQVYMLYEQTPEGSKELKLKVLDMGMGMERNAWFSQGNATMYDAVFPQVVNKLCERTGVVVDKAFLDTYVPVAAFLNLDEVEDIHEAWGRVAEDIGLSVEEVKEKIGPLSSLYSVGEHARSLLVALADGALPSNVGGGYNLRMIYRRAQGFIDEYSWDLDLADVCLWHAQELQEVFPELLECIDDVKKILSVEHKKYLENKQKNKRTIEQVLKKDLGVEELIDLYDSRGVSPEEIVREAKKVGKKVSVPENFYQLVAERHEQSEQKTATTKEQYVNLGSVPVTKILYYDKHDEESFEASVLKIIDNMVVLDKTLFYPTSGGQEHDVGVLGGVTVVDVFKQEGVIIHVLEGKPSFSEGDVITGVIDLVRRKQLAQHHTTTHIINGAARKVLGNHVWQAGAAKTTEKARIDITHFDSLRDEEMQAIEDEANNIVRAAIPISKKIVAKDVAEKMHGFRLYQGGAVPGSEIRVVDIPNFDVEACGGTHLENTSQADLIKLLRSSRIQDGVVRIEFVAGPAAKKLVEAEQELFASLKKELNCEEDQIPGRCEELFKKWKKAKKRKLDKEDVVLSSVDSFPGDILTEAARVLKTQPEHLLKTVKRFKEDINKKLGV